MNGNTRCALVLAGAVVLAGCNADEPTNAGSESGVVKRVGYVYEDGQLRIVRDSTYCAGNTLVDTADTVFGTVSMQGEGMTVVLVDTLVTGTIIRNTREYVRESGSGFTGRWRVAADRNDVTGTPPTTVEVGDWADDTLTVDRMIEQDALYMVIDETDMILTFEGSLTEVLLPMLFAEAPGYLQVAVDTADNGASATVTGSITGEVVTLRFDPRLNTRLSSSESAHPPYYIWEQPSSCGHVQQWWGAFLEANNSFADEFVAEYDLDALAAVLDISVEQQSDFEITITGEITGEVVTAVYDGEQTVTISSTEPDHATKETTRERMAYDKPSWWELFCNENVMP